MNEIIYVGRADGFDAERGRSIAAFAADGGRDVYICRPSGKADGKGLLVCIEQPFMPLPEKPFVLKNAEDLLSAMELAEKYFTAGGATLSALGELIVAFIKTATKTGEQPIVKTLKTEIEENFADGGFSVDVAVSRLPLNGDYIRKLFKKEVGLTPHEYLISLKMKRAKDIMLSGISNRYSQFSVSQIAEACGFSEPLYFSRVFKKYYGVSPANFIKNS